LSVSISKDLGPNFGAVHFALGTVHTGLDLPELLFFLAHDLFHTVLEVLLLDLGKSDNLAIHDIHNSLSWNAKMCSASFCFLSDPRLEAVVDGGLCHFVDQLLHEGRAQPMQQLPQLIRRLTGQDICWDLSQSEIKH